jgi:pyruvate formate lyase activating enzyme
MVFDIQRYSIHDGPGIRTLVFMKGCPLQCLWCCNPESHNLEREIWVTPTLSIGCHQCIDVCPSGAAAKTDPREARQICIVCGRCVDACPTDARKIVGKNMTVGDVIKEVEKDIPFYYRSGGGVTVTGGEPLMQGEFVTALLRRCQERGIHTAIETCGYGEWTVFRKVLKHVDLVLYDIKLMDSKRHSEVTGVGNEVLLENARKAAKAAIGMIIRIPVIPGHTDSHENMRAIAEFVQTLKGVDEIHLLPYHRLGESKYDRLGKPYEMRGVEAPEGGSLHDLKELMKSYHLRVQVGG